MCEVIFNYKKIQQSEDSRTDSLHIVSLLPYLSKPKKFSKKTMTKYSSSVQYNGTETEIHEHSYKEFQFLIGTVQQQYLCGLHDTLFQNIVYNIPKSRSIYFPGHPTNRVKSTFLKMGKIRS